MAVKRKKRSAKKRHAKSNPKKRKRSKKRNPAVSNPKKRRASKKRRAAGARVRRAHAKNPGRKKKRSHKKRRAHRRNPIALANPKRKHRKGKRRHRRNPGIPAWGMAGLAALLGLATYAITNAGSFAATQRIDPSLATLLRNRRIAGAVMVAGGLIVAAVASPVLGAGVAAGGLASLLGTEGAFAIGKVIDKQPETKKIAGVFPAQMQGVFQPPQLMQGVYGGPQRLSDWAAAGYGG